MKTVLVVDDDGALRRLLHLTLAGGQFRVVHAPDGATALGVALRQHVDLVILDVGLPGLDGFAVCRSLKALPEAEQPRVLMLTAHSGQTERALARSLGADDFLAKPFSPSALLDRVGQLLSRSGAPAATGARV